MMDDGSLKRDWMLLMFVAFLGVLVIYESSKTEANAKNLLALAYQQEALQAKLSAAVENQVEFQKLVIMLPRSQPTQFGEIRAYNCLLGSSTVTAEVGE